MLWLRPVNFQTAPIMKAGEPLTLPLVGPLTVISTMLKKMFRDETKPVFDYRDLRRGWCMTCHGLGLGVYDEKRGAIAVSQSMTFANLIRANVDRDTAMSISGRKTSHVFSRYDIQSTDDKRAPLIKAGEYAKQQTKLAHR